MLTEWQTTTDFWSSRSRRTIDGIECRVQLEGCDDFRMEIGGVEVGRAQSSEEGRRRIDQIMADARPVQFA